MSRLPLRNPLCSLVIGSSIFGAAAAATPCDGVNRAVSQAQTVAWSNAVRHQLDDPTATVKHSLASSGWHILSIASDRSDPPFLFYAHDPATSKFVTLWAGAASPDEEASILAWVKKNAPDIPNKLAVCFAWGVTQSQTNWP